MAVGRRTEAADARAALCERARFTLARRCRCCFSAVDPRWLNGGMLEHTRHVAQIERDRANGEVSWPARSRPTPWTPAPHTVSHPFSLVYDQRRACEAMHEGSFQNAGPEHAII